MSAFSYTIEQVVKFVSPVRLSGRCSETIKAINTLTDAVTGELSFLGNKKYLHQVSSSNASVILVPLDYIGEPHENQVYMFCENPSMSLGLFCAEIEKKMSKKFPPSKHATAVVSEFAKLHISAHIGANVFIDDDSEIGENCIIEPGCYIGRGVKIGDRTRLCPGVKVLDFCDIGNDVILYSGAVIGSDGFGYETVNGVHQKIPQIGNVVIEDGVEIGANTTIDRARFKSTVIGRGTKIDNLVQIGHNVKVGQGCLIVSQVGISGSTTLGNYVILGGQTGVVGHVNIGDGCMFGGQSGVNSDCDSGKMYRGTPCMPFNEANRYYVLRKKLPELFRRVDALEQSLEQAN